MRQQPPGFRGSHISFEAGFTLCEIPGMLIVYGLIGVLIGTVVSMFTGGLSWYGWLLAIFGLPLGVLLFLGILLISTKEKRPTPRGRI
jgi:hypothetical protein